MTAIQVSMTFCVISFVLMFISVGRLYWRMFHEDKNEDSEPRITLTRSELEDIIDYAINRTLEAVKKQEEQQK